MTVFSPLRRAGALARTVVFWLRRGTGQRVRALKFIHFAHFALIRRFPDHGQPPEHIRHSLLMFESNYDDAFSEYIDTFAYEAPGTLELLWWRAFGFPGPRPTTPFKSYIKKNEFFIDHYYCAHGAATTREILAALELERRHRRLAARAAALPPDRFAAEYRRFVRDAQELL
jgi:hypothetical protein